MNVKVVRDAIGCTQEELAAILGVTASTVHRWETGKNHPHRSFVKVLENLYSKKAKANK